MPLLGFLEDTGESLSCTCDINCFMESQYLSPIAGLRISGILCRCSLACCPSSTEEPPVAILLWWNGFFQPPGTKLPESHLLLPILHRGNVAICQDEEQKQVYLKNSSDVLQHTCMCDVAHISGGLREDPYRDALGSQVSARSWAPAFLPVPSWPPWDLGDTSLPCPSLTYPCF